MPIFRGILPQLVDRRGRGCSPAATFRPSLPMVYWHLLHVSAHGVVQRCAEASVRPALSRHGARSGFVPRSRPRETAGARSARGGEPGGSPQPAASTQPGTIQDGARRPRSSGTIQPHAQRAPWNTGHTGQGISSFRSYWIPGSYVTSNSMSARSNALPRLRTLCTNSKNPR